MTHHPRPRRVRVASVLGCLAGGLAFFAVLLDLRWAPTRTAIPLGYASNFFDLQAQALLSGRLDVPEGSLGIEGFVIGERTFMYFPPFPAIVRIPVFLITDEFSGRLTVASMGVAWLVFAVMTTRLLWLIGDLALGDQKPTRLEVATSGVFLALLTGGTVLTFNAALPWVYHEVYVWAIATVVGALYWLVRAALNPTPRAIGWLTAFALAAAWTRTTGGAAVSGAIILAGAWAWFSRRHRGHRSIHPRTHSRLFLAASAPLVGLVALNMAKFSHPYMFPLEHQVWTTVNAHRRLALEANGGTITGIDFFASTFLTYFRPDGVRFTPYLPWITLPAEPPPLFTESALFDQTYRTASVTATTPLLLILAIVAVPLLARRRGIRRVLLPPVLGAWAVGLPVLLYGYIANRYTSEFVPGLVVGGMVGFWLTVPPLLRRTARLARATVVVVCLLSTYSILVHFTLGLTTSAVTQQGNRLGSFISTQRSLSGGPGQPQSRLIQVVTELPDSAPADMLAVRDDCSAVYLATGDRYEPWVVVDTEPTVLEITLSRDIRAGEFTVATLEATSSRDVTVEVRRDHHVRVTVRDEFAEVSGPWFGVYPTTSFRLGIAHRSDLGLTEITTTPGGRVAFVPAHRRDDDWITYPGSVTIGDPEEAARHGASMRQVPGLPSRLCHQLLADLPTAAR